MATDTNASFPTISSLFGRAANDPIADLSRVRHQCGMSLFARKWMPAWAQRLQWLFIIAVSLWGAWLMFGDPFGHSAITIGIFALIIVPVGVRAYYMIHAVARGELNPLTGRDTRD